MPARRRMRRVKLKGRILFPVMAIILVNTVGVGYAYWNEPIPITAVVSVGSLDARFCERSLYLDEFERGNNDKGHLTATFSGKDIYITGTVEPGYKADLIYKICSSGSIPFKYTGTTGTFPDQKNMMKVDDDLTDGNGWLHIQADKPGKYPFDTQLQFQQDTP